MTCSNYRVGNEKRFCSRGYLLTDEKIRTECLGFYRDCYEKEKEMEKGILKNKSSQLHRAKQLLSEVEFLQDARNTF